MANLNDGIFYFCDYCKADTLHAIDFIAEEIADGTLKDREPHARRCLTCGNEVMFKTLQQRVQAQRKAVRAGAFE